MSSWGADRLSPRIQRTATVTLLERAQRVELASMEDPEFNRLLESARFGINSVHRLTTESVAVLSTLLSMAATGGVLFTLSPVLLPLLVLIAAPARGARPSPPGGGTGCGRPRRTGPIR
ncbi:ATP-binding cassette subfamily B protein [Kitasatospora sp. SolWspMP-SS2h]|uniref:hypothetical protein n=1 Tax=Kitasatospora sp. SolWspMP-SS2h TaxID=1305729 RepID=UPI000DBA5785|nr:hypothetical protein [Kitasatospora sp. SolWspMP-SS2h]RAJ38398.1 ATP-binding cassette subfamily B protein [Kitasatospora sp. SolWspMP-SS2h]